MVCQYLDEFYEMFLLGTVSADAGSEIGRHLERGCPYCLAQLREAARTIYLLAQMTPAVRPGPKLKSQLLRRLSKK